MINSPSTGRVRFLVTVILLYLIPCPAWSMTYYWGRHPQKERLVFAFSSRIPHFTLQRTGPTRLTLSLPKDIWRKDPPPAPVALDDSRMIAGLSRNKNIIFISLKTSAFGFIYFPLVQQNKLVVDIFRDPMGTQWNPPVSKKKVPATKKTISSSPKIQTKPARARKTVPVAPEPLAPKVSQQTNTATAPESRRFLVNRPPTASRSLHQLRQGPFRFKVKRQDAEHAFTLSALNKGTKGKEDHSGQGPVLNQPTPETRKKPEPDTTVAASDTTRANATSSQPQAENRSEKTVPGTTSPQSPAERNGTDIPNFKELLVTTKANLNNGNLDTALEALRGMLKNPNLPNALREETLYLVAETLFQKYHLDMENHFQEVMTAFQSALSFNPKSLHMPSALLSMGLANLDVGNIPEAKAYFQLVRKKYPNDSNTPLTYYYMGGYYLRHKNYQKAADNFQYVVQQYPDSSIDKASAIGLTKSLKELGFYRQDYEFMDYVEKRWPRYYIEDPEFLMLSGYIKFKNHKLDQAKNDFWLYLNIAPEGKHVDIALARIGDIYVMKNQKKPAREVYERAARMYPDKEGGLIAKMRLAEEGIFDSPSLKKMFSVFDKPYSLRPKEVYTQIITKYPNSPLAPVAYLKLAMWQFWSNKFIQTLQTVASFAQKHPHQELLPKAWEVGRKAFARWVSKSIQKNRYQAIVSTWKKYPFLHQKPDPGTRLAIASSFWKIGSTEQALMLAEPFLSGAIPLNASSGPALDLVLAILVKSQSWQKILDVSKNIRPKDLVPKRRRQFEYTRALAYENLGYTDKSDPLWIKLASDSKLDDAQLVYSLYFLAKHAEQTKDLKQEYMMAQQALSLFLGMPQAQRDIPRILDCLNMLIHVTSRSRRIQEALRWGMEYEKYIPKDDPSWPAHMYTLANLYKINQDIKMWRKKLTSIIKEYPGSIYSKMAAADLESAKLQKKMRPFD